MFIFKSFRTTLKALRYKSALVRCLATPSLPRCSGPGGNGSVVRNDGHPCHLNVPRVYRGDNSTCLSIRPNQSGEHKSCKQEVLRTFIKEAVKVSGGIEPVSLCRRPAASPLQWPGRQGRHREQQLTLMMLALQCQPSGPAYPPPQCVMV
jgi:hypothetical protein